MIKPDAVGEGYWRKLLDAKRNQNRSGNGVKLACVICYTFTWCLNMKRKVEIRSGR